MVLPTDKGDAMVIPNTDYGAWKFRSVLVSPLYRKLAKDLTQSVKQNYTSQDVLAS
jgi:hypothetical protein